MARRANLNEAQKARVENVGRAGGLGHDRGRGAGRHRDRDGSSTRSWPTPEIFHEPSYLAGVVFMALIAWMLIKVPLNNAGDPNEPAPPVAIM